MNPANDPNFVSMLQERMQRDLVLKESVHTLFRTGDLSFLLHDGQRIMLEAAKRKDLDELLIFCSRQLGKSFYIITYAIEHCIQNPDTVVRIFASTIKQIQDIVADNLAIIQKLAPEDLITRKKSDRRWMVGSSEIRLGTIADAHVDKSRGGNCSLAIIEEGGFVDSDTYQNSLGSVIAPMLLRSGGRLINVTTPSKDAHHYIHREILPKLEPKGAVIRIDINGNPQLTKYQKDQLQNRLTAEQWQRECMVEIVVDSESTVVPEFSQDDHVKEMVPPKFAYWLTAIDLGGTQDKTASLLCYYDFIRAVFCVYDECFFPHNTSLDEIISKTKQMERKARWIEDSEDRVCDVPGQVLIELRHQDFYMNVPKKGPGSFEAGINVVRHAFNCNQIEIHPRCKNTIMTVKYGQYTKNRKDFERTEALGHLDALAALIYGFQAKNTDNPYPKYHGKSRFDHHIPDIDDGYDDPLEEALLG